MLDHTERTTMHYIPQDDQERKDAPLFRGLLGYFPAALFEVAAHSLDSDKKHNPGNVNGPTWVRAKSSDHEDCIVRHVIDAGPRRTWLRRLPAWLLEKIPGSSARDARRYHLRCLAWRALALLQEDCEATGSMPGTSSRFPEPPASAVTEHPAKALARDALLAEEVRNLIATSTDSPGLARVQGTKLVRQRLGCMLSEAKAWMDRNIPKAAA
jgi:hypothetical protein